MVNLLQSERDALAKELQVMCATEEDVRPEAKKQAVARLAISHREVQGAVPLMPRHVPNDMMSWLQDRQAEQHDAVMMGDLHHVTELGQAMSEGVKHLAEISLLLWPIWSREDVCKGDSSRRCRKRRSSPFSVLCDSKTPQPTARIVEHRCGMQGVRVGEASNPGASSCGGEGGGSED